MRIVFWFANRWQRIPASWTSWVTGGYEFKFDETDGKVYRKFVKHWIPVRSYLEYD